MVTCLKYATGREKPSRNEKFELLRDIKCFRFVTSLQTLNRREITLWALTGCWELCGRDSDQHECLPNGPTGLHEARAMETAFQSARASGLREGTEYGMTSQPSRSHLSTLMILLAVFDSTLAATYGSDVIIPRNTTHFLTLKQLKLGFSGFLWKHLLSPQTLGNPSGSVLTGSEAVRVNGQSKKHKLTVC